MSKQPLALVIGFTIHGLAVARSLSRKGVEVHAFTLPEGRYKPTRYTRYATVHVRDKLNTDALIGHLEQFARDQPAAQAIVLFPTSDRMAASIGQHWDRLRDRFLLSWAHCRELVLSIQLKDNLPALARRSGILHPATVRIDSEADWALATRQLSLPFIVKPVRPLSSFKAIVVSTAGELTDLSTRYRADLPFLAQQLIPGNEGHLYACTTYLDHGRELCMFTSRKLAAYPPGLGQGVVFVAESNPEIEALTRQLLAGLDLSGPVAVEFKRDDRGRYWMIEPNVGRTEYCVDLAIQSGADVPWIEYCHVTGRPVPPRSPPVPERRLWFDTDRDALCYRRYRKRLRAGAAPAGLPVFPFAGTGDWRPQAVSFVQGSWTLAKRWLRPEE